MQQPTSVEDIRAALQQAETRQAFLAWFIQKYPTRAQHAEKFANNPTLGVWQGFCQSPEGQAIHAPSLQASLTPAAPIVPESTPAAPKPLPVSPAPMSASIEPEAVPRAPVAAVEPPARATTHNGHKSGTQAALFDLLAQGLQESGFKASLDAEQVRGIAEKAAEAEFQRFLASQEVGRTLHVKIGDKPAIKLADEVPAWFDRALKLASARQNCLLIGPAGAGKSYGAKLIAKALDLAYTPISLSGGTDEGVLVGWLLPVAEGGRFIYVPSAFVDAYEHGGVVLLDELDAADPNVLLVVNEALANGHFPLPLRRDKPVAEKHEDFVCLAAANTHGHGADRVYVGRNQLDGATLSRFRIGQINVDFDETLERRLYADSVVKYGQRLRARCRAIKGWTRDVSTRDLAGVQNLVVVHQTFTLEEAWYGFFSDWSEGDCEKVDIERDHGRMQARLR